jgi:hypothetical protein
MMRLLTMHIDVKNRCLLQVSSVSIDPLNYVKEEHDGKGYTAPPPASPDPPAEVGREKACECVVTKGETCFHTVTPCTGKLGLQAELSRIDWIA